MTKHKKINAPLPTDKVWVDVTVQYTGTFKREITRAEFDEACEACAERGGAEPEDFGWFDFRAIEDCLRGEIEQIEETVAPKIAKAVRQVLR